MCMWVCVLDICVFVFVSVCVRSTKPSEHIQHKYGKQMPVSDHHPGQPSSQNLFQVGLPFSLILRKDIRVVAVVLVDSEWLLWTCSVLTYDSQIFRWMRHCWYEVALGAYVSAKIQAFGIIGSRMSSWCRWKCLDKLESESNVLDVVTCVGSMGKKCSVLLSGTSLLLLTCVQRLIGCRGVCNEVANCRDRLAETESCVVSSS